MTADTLAAEFVEKVLEMNAEAVCIGSLPPTGWVQVRYLCKRLRQQNTSVRILVGRWGDADNPEAFRELLDVGANAVEVTLAASIRQLNEWRPLTPEGDAEPAKEIPSRDWHAGCPSIRGGNLNRSSNPPSEDLSWPI